MQNNFKDNLSGDLLKVSASIIKTSPHLVEKVWGGVALQKASKSSRPIGESWEVADLEDGQCSCAGISIRDFVNARGSSSDFWGEHGRCPYVVKYIDAAENLSLQVHPSDEYVRNFVNENGQGKSECWIILGTSALKSQEEAKTPGIYLGMKPGSDRTHFEQSLYDLSSCHLLQMMNFYPVIPGDFWVVPAGTVHAIGAGVMLLEIQQFCGITYRIWDWNRKNSRELHIEQALGAINFDSTFNGSLAGLAQKNIWRQVPMPMDGKAHSRERLLYEHPDFRVSILNLRTNDLQIFSLEQRECKRALTILCIEGKIEVARGDDRIVCDCFETLLLPFAGPTFIEIFAFEKSKVVIVD
ncbi:MAG: class I mannose-6-phosphate isomerase [Oligoflexia bacterium]|nr:class I mannose-6-phosphate isomerase [Oligoflexia bacterium]MBF0365882.1 class I mannose-6-phosphate isomerase [Oligoflexia bacterium]